MKILRCFLVLCIMAFAFNVDANAQVASKAGKIVKEVVKKGSKSTSKVKPKSNNYKPTTVRPKLRTTTVECSSCEGHGKVNVWNPYYGYWQTQTCNRCDGTGRVRSN